MIVICLSKHEIVRISFTFSQNKNQFTGKVFRKKVKNFANFSAFPKRSEIKCQPLLKRFRVSLLIEANVRKIRNHLLRFYSLYSPKAVGRQHGLSG